MKKFIAASLIGVTVLSGCSLQTGPKEQKAVNEESITLNDFELGRHLPTTRATFNGTLEVDEPGYLSVTLNEPGLINNVLHGEYDVDLTAKDGEVVPDEEYNYSGVLLSNKEGTYTLTFTLKDDNGEVISETYRTFTNEDVKTNTTETASTEK